jgi:two-component system response regulator AtoC
VRELENIIERCAALSISEVIARNELPSFILKGDRGAKNLFLIDAAASAEKEHILKVLKITRGNKTKSAEMLGISRKTLWEKMRAYEIS